LSDARLSWGDCRVSSLWGDGLVWDRELNKRSWRWYLGKEGAKADDVGQYVSPALAKSLAGLPRGNVGL